MSLVDLDRPDDERIVLAEVVVHLREVDRGRLDSPGRLAAAWDQVRRCDAAVVDVLEPAVRREYQSIVDAPRPARPSARGWSFAPALRTGVAHLHVAVHRRLMVLQLVLNETAPGVADDLR